MHITFSDVPPFSGPKGVGIQYPPLPPWMSQRLKLKVSQAQCCGNLRGVPVPDLEYLGHSPYHRPSGMTNSLKVP